MGALGAFGAYAFETNLAVSDARAAAHELEDKRSALEAELTAAHDAIHEAQDVVDEEKVSRAAQALSDATRTATESAALSGVLVAVGPLDPQEIAELASRAEQLSEVSLASEDATAVASVVDPMARTESDGADEVTVDVDDAPGAGYARPSAAAHPLPTGDSETDVVEDAEVAKVLAGEADSAEQARAAAQRLEEAADALDEAARSVGSGADALSEAALEAAHLDTLDAMDAAMSEAAAVIAESTALIDAVTDRVRPATKLDAAEDALVEFDSAAATSALVDRASPARVIEQFDRLTEAATTLTAAMGDLRMSHEGWVARENRAIDARNEALQAEHESAVADARAAHAQANRDAVAARPNGWSGQPVGVAGSNGAISSTSMCPVSFAPGHRLQCDAARALEDANAVYHAQTGQHLAMTDSYRSFALQVRTRALKPATAARPGTSNHGWGMAVDLDKPSSAWLTANGAEFGWVHPVWARPGGARPEFWHLEYVATDVGAFQAPTSPRLEDHVESAFMTVAENQK